MSVNLERGSISISLKCGSVTGVPSMTKLCHEAIVDGFTIGFLRGWDRFEPIVAKDTGLMRKFMRLKLTVYIRREIATQKINYLLYESEIQRIMRNAIIYAIYHVINDEPDYKRPTTPGTKRITDSEISQLTDLIFQEVDREIDNQLRLKGFEIE